MVEVICLFFLAMPDFNSADESGHTYACNALGHRQLFCDKRGAKKEILTPVQGRHDHTLDNASVVNSGLQQTLVAFYL